MFFHITNVSTTGLRNMSGCARFVPFLQIMMMMMMMMMMTMATTTTYDDDNDA